MPVRANLRPDDGESATAGLSPPYDDATLKRPSVGRAPARHVDASDVGFLGEVSRCRCVRTSNRMTVDPRRLA